jgi:hypothetical protein
MMSLLAAFQVGGDGLQLENGHLASLVQELGAFVGDAERKSGMVDFAVVISFAWGLYLYSIDGHREVGAEIIRKAVEKVLCFVKNWFVCVGIFLFLYLLLFAIFW